MRNNEKNSPAGSLQLNINTDTWLYPLHIQHLTFITLNVTCSKRVTFYTLVYNILLGINDRRRSQLSHL